MLSANFKPKRTAAASRGFLATAWLSCFTCNYGFKSTKSTLCRNSIGFVSSWFQWFWFRADDVRSLLCWIWLKSSQITGLSHSHIYTGCRRLFKSPRTRVREGGLSAYSPHRLLTGTAAAGRARRGWIDTNQRRGRHLVPEDGTFYPWECV